MPEFLIFLTAGLWRWFDGTDKTVNGVKVRGLHLITTPLAFAAAWVGLGNWIAAAWCAVIVTYLVLSGMPGWHSRPKMIAKYTTGAVVISAGLVVMWRFGVPVEPSWGWLVYPASTVLIAYSYKWMIEEAARVMLGSILIGGLVVL